MNLNFENKIIESQNPVNLTSNGNFTIDQKHTYWSATTASAGTYATDLWHLNTVQPTCTVETWLKTLLFKGYATAGQQIILTNRDNYNFTHFVDPDIFIQTKNEYGNFIYYSYITSVLNAYVVNGNMKFRCRPRYDSTDYSVIFDNQIDVRSNNENVKVTASKCHLTNATNINTRAAIFIDFLEDGYFEFHITAFRELPGYYPSPPKSNSCSSIFTDLERCQKYYQFGAAVSQVPMFVYLGSNYSRDYIRFAPEMISTPSISTTFRGASQNRMKLPTNFDVLSDAPPYTGWSIQAENIINTGFRPLIGRTTQTTDHQILYAAYYWYANV